MKLSWMTREEDLSVVHVSKLKPWFPYAHELEVLQKRRLQEIFKEDSDDEEFLGFTEKDI